MEFHWVGLVLDQAILWTQVFTVQVLVKTVVANLMGMLCLTGTVKGVLRRPLLQMDS